MKRKFLNFWTYAVIAFMGISVVMTSCKDEPVPDPDPVVEDGIYIKGGGTALEELGANGLMTKAVDENGQEERATMYEMYLPIEAGTEGFNIVIVEGGVQKTYGPGADFALVPVAERNMEQPSTDFWRGTYAETATAFTVPVNGMYHVILDTVNKKVVVAVVEWGIIGGATPTAWTASTPMPAGAFAVDAMSFKVENFELRKGDFKFRYGNNWKIIVDSTDVAHHVRVNTNFGGTISGTLPNLEVALTQAKDNNVVLALTQEGKYTIALDWTVADGWKASLTKTADVTPIGPETFLFSLIGSAFNNADGVPANWDYDIDLPYASVSGDAYSFTKNGVALLAGGEFKIRKDHDWGTNFGYTGVTIEGDAANFTDNNGNIKVTEAKTYNVTFVYDNAGNAHKLIMNIAK